MINDFVAELAVFASCVALGVLFVALVIASRRN